MVRHMSLRRSHGRVPTRDINLRELLLEVSEHLQIGNMNVFLFGSRKDRTGSVRSDIDILLISDRRLTQDEAEWVWRHESYLDIFVARNGTASSLVNESELTAESNDALS
jgi:predicted nucleotidyltransferase